ncbi:hypothetical protein OESDEN_18224 [Oesophagostomum dentatum]|uniref:Uncharacterized protein n=1 Tax=Oesophagostomum dentatum TaxID=61180 RepID=A0A0B1SB03_OESDE|nr:hypothetical protein OESDEN_18224 [Oesophagostomum dentatum]
MMILSALATIVCFQLEKSYSSHSNKTSSTPLTPSEITPPELPSPTDLLHREDIENLLSTVTLIAAILFFFSFFMAMYAHVKVREFYHVRKIRNRGSGGNFWCGGLIISTLN